MVGGWCPGTFIWGLSSSDVTPSGSGDGVIRGTGFIVLSPSPVILFSPAVQPNPHSQVPFGFLPFLDSGDNSGDFGTTPLLNGVSVSGPCGTSLRPERPQGRLGRRGGRRHSITVGPGSPWDTSHVSTTVL